MGVDMYLDSIWRPYYEAIKRANPETAPQIYEQLSVSGGYFRDPFNDADVMWAMGLSWLEDVRPLLNTECYLPVENAHKLVAMIETRPISPEILAQHVPKNMSAGKTHVAAAEGASLPPHERPGFGGLLHFLTNKREELLAILRKSIELHEPLAISL